MNKQEVLVSRLRENYRVNHARVMDLKTRSEAEACCAEVRAKIDMKIGSVAGHGVCRDATLRR